MNGVFGQLLLLILLTSTLPVPRWNLYRTGLLVSVIYSTRYVVIVKNGLKPFIDVSKVSFHSKGLSAIIQISTLAPKAGEFILSRSHWVEFLKHSFETRVGSGLVDFRFDLRRKYVQYEGELEGITDKGLLYTQIKHNRSLLRRRHEVGEIVVAIAIGILSLIASIISVWWGIALLLTLYSLMFPISLTLRTTVIDTLAYSADLIDENEEFPNRPRLRILRFMKEWNQMLLDNEAMIHRTILVSFLRGEFPEGYDRGTQLMEEIMNEGKGLDEALDDLVNESLGENTLESRWFRRVIRRFFGL